jgi:hypothetical protein
MVKMSVDRIVELERWAGRLRKEVSLDQAIDTIQERMNGATEDDAHQLALILKGFLVEARREFEAEQLLDDRISRAPDDVRLRIEKATLYLYFLENPERALEAINGALTKAHSRRAFRREALGVKARILLRLGQGDLLSQTLEQIMALQIGKGEPDIRRERDFVDRAPAGLISENVLARYNTFCPPVTS